MLSKALEKSRKVAWVLVQLHGRLGADSWESSGVLGPDMKVHVCFNMEPWWNVQKWHPLWSFLASFTGQTASRVTAVS